MEDDIDWEDYLSEKHRNVPLHALKYSATRRIGLYLNQQVTLNQDDIVPDFGGLAELIGFDGIEIQNFERAENSGKAVLEEWKRRPELEPTLARFFQLLAELGREDILTDCHERVAREAEEFLNKKTLFEQDKLPVQEPTVSQGPGYDYEEPPPFLTVDEVMLQQEVIYDAFVCYNPLGNASKDMKFVRELIMRFEKPPYCFKLFIPGRDDLSGLSKHEIDAKIISKRCRHMIVVLSNNFAESPACQFQSAFAHSLSPGAKNKRLVPVIIEEVEHIPNIMRFMSYCDFSKPALLEWAWERLGRTIQVQLSFEDFRLKPSTSSSSLNSCSMSQPAQISAATSPSSMPSSSAAADSGFWTSAEGQSSSQGQSSSAQSGDEPTPADSRREATAATRAFETSKPVSATVESSWVNKRPNSPSLGSRAFSKFKQKFSGRKSKSVLEPSV